MKVLIIKLSSMGDIFHTYPAITDVQQHFPNAEVSWLVDAGFKVIADWHPFVSRVIPVALRQAKKNKSGLLSEIRQLKTQLEQYDVVIDAQGLIKSALLSRLLKAPTHGYDRKSVREPLAALLYRHRHAISKQQHAALRTRQLFAAALGYSLSDLEPDFGISGQSWGELDSGLISKLEKKSYAVLIPGTTWNSKYWPLTHWQALVNNLYQAGLHSVVLWGSQEEKHQAQEIAKVNNTAAIVPGFLKYREVSALLSSASLAVGVDTGFTHLAGALAIPTIGLYGPTSFQHVGLIGKNTRNLFSNLACQFCHKRLCPLIEHQQDDISAPLCMQELTPAIVFAAASELL